MQKTIDDLGKRIEEIDRDLSQGHVSVQEASSAVSEMNDTWDEFAANLARQGIDLGAFAKGRFGNETYEAFGGIKKGATAGISSVSSFFSAVDSFKGSWRTPGQARQKLETGLKQISAGVTQLGTTLSNVAQIGNAMGNVMSNAKGHPVLNQLGGGIITGATGIGRFGGNLTNLGTGMGNNPLLKIAGPVAGVISGIANNNWQSTTTTPTTMPTTTGSKSLLSTNREKQSIQRNETDAEQAETPTQAASETNTDTSKIDEPAQKDATNNAGSDSGSSSSSSYSSSEDNYSADMISEINVVLDGSSSSQNSLCSINGNEYRLSGYSLMQELLHPMFLSFSIEKEDKIETDSDVIFADATQIIGKSIEVRVSTIKTSQNDNEGSSQKAFIFKGMIINVSAARSTASSQSASITAATWDALLQNALHCRSFENMTLKEIVDSVLKPYSDVQSKISPRLQEKIPYIVQYNQSDYGFISMLAIRFGEWMYNTGETFVFGEMDNSSSSEVKLEYPGGSLMSYNLCQNMNAFMFNHLLTDYYQFGKEKGILKESAQGLADGKLNDWTDMAYNASMQRFNNEQIAAIGASGFDSGKDNEGADTILDYSLKIEALGKKTGLMTIHGNSKLAMLKIGQTFQIHDNVQNKSGESKDIQQKALKIIGVNHSFDYRQEYSNFFTAIPVACGYPSYANADLYALAPQQRAKVVENKDEQKLGRIRVQFPWQEIQSKDMKTPWLRIAVPYAGASKGQQFVPEIGEEVMVGFEMNNAERPYIIGSFYNGGSGKPDENWAVSKEEDGTTNNIKSIRTRNGHTILFNDKGEHGLLEIYDNKDNTYHITLSADDKKITIYSAADVEVIADNDIHVSAEGNIHVCAEGDIDVAAKGDIGIKADGDIGIKSKGSISMEAKKEVSIQASKVKVR